MRAYRISSPRAAGRRRCTGTSCNQQTDGKPSQNKTEDTRSFQGIFHETWKSYSCPHSHIATFWVAFCYEKNLELSGRCQSHKAPPLLRSAHAHGILRSVCKQKARVIAASRKFLYFRVTKEMTIKTSTVGAPLTTALQQSSESYGRNIRAEFLWIRTFHRLR